MGQGEELVGINLTMLLIYLQLFTAYRIKSKVCGMTYAYQSFMTFPSLIFHNKLSLSTLLCSHRSPSLYMELPIPITLCHPIPPSHPSVPRLTSPSNPSKAPEPQSLFPKQSEITLQHLLNLNLHHAYQFPSVNLSNFRKVG